MAFFTVPVLAMMAGGAALGGGLAAGLGPKDEPLWKKLLLGGGLGAVGGMAGAAGLGLGGSAAGTVGASTVAAPLTGAGVNAAGATGAVAPALASLGTASAAPTTTLAAAPGIGLGGTLSNAAGSVAGTMANNPMMSAVTLGGLGMTLLPEEEERRRRGMGVAPYSGPSSWQTGGPQPQVASAFPGGFQYNGGIGRSYFG